MNTIPGRVNELEKLTHTLDHRMQQIEHEQLPVRVQRVELTMGRMEQDLTEIKTISQDTMTKLEDGITQLKNDGLRQRSFVLGIIWAAGGIVTLMQFGPTISYVIKQMVK